MDLGVVPGRLGQFRLRLLDHEKQLPRFVQYFEPELNYAL